MVDQDHPLHPAAVAFAQSIGTADSVAISEFALLELYNLLRNPVILEKPLSANAAVDICQAFREHPRWQIIGFPPDSRPFHDAFWPRLRAEDFARRRSFDWRLALSLLRQGVSEFATGNVKDFEGFGFKKVWNPLLLESA